MIIAQIQPGNLSKTTNLLWQGIKPTCDSVTTSSTESNIPITVDWVFYSRLI